MDAALSPEPAGGLQLFAQQLHCPCVCASDRRATARRRPHDVSLDGGAQTFDRPERRVPGTAHTNAEHLTPVDLNGNTPSYFGEQRSPTHRWVLPIDWITHGPNRRGAPALVL